MARRKNISKQTKTLLLALLTKPRDWHYGYSLVQSTELKSGTIYPILSRLHEQEFLEAEWSTPEKQGERPRHKYRLTKSGLSLAKQAEYEARENNILPERGVTG